MSAFFDIWMGASAPLYKRGENAAWQKLDFDKQSYWISQPENSNTQFVKRVSSEGYHMLVIGQFYEPVDDSKLLRDCVGYINNSSRSFSEPAGHYIIFILDEKHNNYHIFTNRLGTYHAYWMNGKQKAIGTYFLGMAKQAESKGLDWEGITGFLAMGFFPNDRTYLTDIKILQPASYYCFSGDFKLLRHKRYWDWSHEVSEDLPDKHISGLDEIMQTSLSYSLRGHRVALPVSGGLDSRTLAGVITKNKHQGHSSLWAYSYGYRERSVETSIAQKIALSRQINFNSYKVPNYLFDKMDLIASSVDLFQYVDGTRQACMKEELEANADVVVGGHWGDVWMDDMGIGQANTNNIDNQLLSTFEKKIIKRGSDWLLSAVADDHLPNSRQFLHDYFRSTINKYKHIKDPDFRFKAYKTDEWSFRWTLASIRMYQAAVFPVLPFYDKRIVDLFSKMPTKVVKDRKFQIEYLKKYHPDLAKIRWQEYGRNLYSYKYFNNRNIVYRGFNKIKRTINNEKPILRNWEIFYLNVEGKKQLENILLQQPAFNDIVPKQKCQALLDNFYNNPSAANGYAVSMLHTFARFIEEIS